MVMLVFYLIYPVLLASMLVNFVLILMLFVLVFILTYKILLGKKEEKPYYEKSDSKEVNFIKIFNYISNLF
ncbi:hypothetical protein CGEO_0322 [Campylobacter geochelonis]|nr:hypothetical protein CGEO_0322 [Campylobacter geochelonis]